MTEIIAVTMAAFMIPAAPFNAIKPENYSAYSEPTAAYVQQINEPIGTGIVYTPNGSEIDVEYYKDNFSAAEIDRLTYYFVGNEDYSGYYVNISDEVVTLKDKSIYRVGSPTTTYNALAFAFYMYWESVPYNSSACWIRDASAYINDKSYIPVSEPQVNDIVCYYSNEGIVNAGVVEYVFENEATDPTDSRSFVKKLSKINVKSMWGAYGLYQHRGDQCPFVGKYVEKNFENLEAVSVKYFRRHETHTYNHKYTINNATTHKSYCVCGDYKAEPHIWVRYLPGQKHCSLCGYATTSSRPLILPTLADVLNFDFNDIDYKELSI